MKIGFVGMGKLGRDVAEVLDDHYDVLGYDIEHVETSVNMADSISSCVSDRDIVFCAVPTPHDPSYDGRHPTSHLPPKDFDYRTVTKVVAEIDDNVASDTLIVLISTTLPGTVRRLIAPIVKNGRFIYNPYLIAQTTVKWDMCNPEMIIIGTANGEKSKDSILLSKIYETVCENEPRIEVGTWDEAESIKIFYNTFITAKLCLVNMIQDCAMKVGNINVDVVTEALKKSSMRIMGPSYMRAGLGDGGGCHPRDNIALRWLAEQYDFGYDLFDSIVKTREAQAQQMARFICDQSNSDVVILGTGFKPKTDQLHGSPSILVGYYCEVDGDRTVHYVNDPLDSRPELQDGEFLYLLGHFDGSFDQFNFTHGSTIIDPWRNFSSADRPDLQVIHYGDTRRQTKESDAQSIAVHYHPTNEEKYVSQVR